jgi:hypothetical protein
MERRQSLPDKTEYAGQPRQNMPANHHKTRRPTHKTPKKYIYIYIFFFFSQEGVPVTIKQERNSSMEFFEGTTCVGCATANKRKTKR